MYSHSNHINHKAPNTPVIMISYQIYTRTAAVKYICSCSSRYTASTKSRSRIYLILNCLCMVPMESSIATRSEVNLILINLQQRSTTQQPVSSCLKMSINHCRNIMKDQVTNGQTNRHYMSVHACLQKGLYPPRWRLLKYTGVSSPTPRDPPPQWLDHTWMCKENSHLNSHSLVCRPSSPPHFDHFQ